MGKEQESKEECGHLDFNVAVHQPYFKHVEVRQPQNYTKRLNPDLGGLLYFDGSIAISHEECSDSTSLTSLSFMSNLNLKTL